MPARVSIGDVHESGMMSWQPGHAGEVVQSCA